MSEAGKRSGTPGPDLYPVVPLRDLVVFPHTIVPLHIGRKKSVNALAVEDVAGGRSPILLVTQKNNDADPSPEAIYRVGTLATIMQWMKFDDGSVKVLLECKERARIARFVETTDYLEAEVERVVDTTPDSTGAIEGLARSAAARFTQYVRANEQISPEAVHIVKQVRDASELADLVASYLAIETASRQELLETTSTLGRLQAILSFMGNDLHDPIAAKGNQSPASRLDAHADTRLRKLHVTQYAVAITRHRRTSPIPAGTRLRRPFAVWINSNGLLSGCCLEKVPIGERWRRKAT